MTRLPWALQMHLPHCTVEMGLGEPLIRGGVTDIGPYFDKSTFGIKREGPDATLF